MKKLNLIATLVAAFICITVIQSCKSSGKASTTKLLKFNLEKAKGYDYDMVWDMDQKIMGQESKISIGGLYSMKVLSDSDHIKTLAGTYRNFKMNMKVMGMEIDVDTDKPLPSMSEEDMQANPMRMVNKIFSGIIGKAFILKVDEEGKIIEASGFKEIINDIADSLELSDDVKEKMMASLEDQFNEQSIRDSFAPIFTIFPNKEIKIGDSWEKSYTTAGKIPARFSTTYTVKEIEGDHVALSTKTQIESTGDMAEVNGDQTGDIIVDSKSGLMINGYFIQKIQTKVQGMSMTINGTGKIKGTAN